MLKRIYIDNYKSLVNFEMNALQPINLFVGPNGSGKSIVFEALRHIRSFVEGNDKITDLFNVSTRTRWHTLPTQVIELEILRDTGVFKYELSSEPTQQGDNAQVVYERLWFNQQPLLKFENGEVQLYSDNHAEGSKYPFDRSQSALAFIEPRNDNRLLTWFKKELALIIIVHPIPPVMQSESIAETSAPTLLMENFVSWYRYISHDQGLAYLLIERLRDVLPGFDHFKLESFSRDHRSLQVIFQTDNKEGTSSYDFNELSDGQRMLIVLYTLLYANQRDSGPLPILCLDEPENFISLPEIQPWLIELYDRCNEGKLQALLISHHPELLNYLLESPGGYWFERQNNGPSRVKFVQMDNTAGLSISELVARGWLVNE